MRKEPSDKMASAEAIKVSRWAFAKGSKTAEDLDYIPMPDNVINLINLVGRYQELNAIVIGPNRVKCYLLIKSELKRDPNPPIDGVPWRL